MTLAAGLSALGVVNLWAMLRFWQDKRWARRGKERISEARLLALALIGGTPGTLLARHLFRHKTRKQPFSTYLYLIALLQVGLVVGYLAIGPY